MLMRAFRRLSMLLGMLCSLAWAEAQTPFTYSIPIIPVDSVTEYLAIDSLLRPENRFYLSQEEIRQTDSMLVWLDSMDLVMEEECLEWLPEHTAPREPSDVLRYIRRYNLMKKRPRPAAPQPYNEDSTYYPGMNQLFLPMVFNAHRPAQHLDRAMVQHPESQLGYRFAPSEAEEYVGEMTIELLNDLEVTYLDRVDYRVADLPEYERIDAIIANDKPIRIERPRYEIRPTVRQMAHMKYEYNYWTLKGRVSAQMTQNYVSSNWSSGGMRNMATQMSFYWTAKYDDKKKIQFDNLIDLKIGLNTTDADTLRKVAVSTDQLQMSSKLGYKAVKNWYYSASAEVMTQLLNKHKPNTNKLQASLLSPAKFFFSLGMDYKVTSRDKKRNFSLLLTPLTYRLNFLLDTVNYKASSYGIDPGKKVGHEFGFKLTSNFDYKITENISWTSYLYYYSDFTYIDSEWKNTINFQVNQYLTTQLYLHFKFNDRQRGEKADNRIQFKEYLSFGVAYYW